jgi:transcriptional regulator with XRE-family HTH domain
VDVGRKVRELRIRRGMIIENIVRKTGLSKPYMSQVETEKTSPSLQTVQKLGVPLTHLFLEDAIHGPVLGAALFVFLREYLALRWADLHLLIFGVVHRDRAACRADSSRPPGACALWAGLAATRSVGARWTGRDPCGQPGNTLPCRD